MYCGLRRPRQAHDSRSAVDHEYEELLEEETAEPKESSKEPHYHAYHAYHAPFSHFPGTPGPWEGASGPGTGRGGEGLN